MDKENSKIEEASELIKLAINDYDAFLKKLILLLLKKKKKLLDG